jgi:hypothetical protein
MKWQFIARFIRLSLRVFLHSTGDCASFVSRLRNSGLSSNRNGQLESVGGKYFEILAVEGRKGSTLGDGSGGNHGIHTQATGALCGITKLSGDLCLNRGKWDDAPFKKASMVWI